MKRLALTAICLACLCVSAAAQDAKTVIANAQKALGDPKSITYSGSAKDVAFQQCGANTTQMNCQGPHNPMRPISNYVRVIDLNTSATRQTGGTNNIGPGGSTTTAPGTFFAQVTTQQADVAQPWGGSVDFYLTPWGFLNWALVAGPPSPPVPLNPSPATVEIHPVRASTRRTWRLSRSAARGIQPRSDR